MNKLFFKILTLLAYVTMVSVNYLAVWLPLGGRSTGEISDNYPNLFAPAGYAFSIWGLIYLLLGIYVAYHFTRREDQLVARVSRIFIANALLNAAWIFAWHFDFIWLSVLIMLGLLITLIKIADLIRKATLSAKERFFICLPFSVYFGWITVATIANISVFLVSLNWNRFGFSDVFWTVIILLVGAAIGIWRTLYDRKIPYALVLVWSYGAILAKHLPSGELAGKYPAVIYTAVFCLVLFLASIIIIVLKPEQKEKKSE